MGSIEFKFASFVLRWSGHPCPGIKGLVVVCLHPKLLGHEASCEMVQRTCHTHLCNRSAGGPQCALTLRSRRGPTAGHQARAGGTRTFSPARAWRPTVGPASPQTLGLATETVQCSSRFSACRRVLNSHEGRSRQYAVGPPPRGTFGSRREIAKDEEEPLRRQMVETTLERHTKTMTGNRRATSEHRAAWEAIVISRFVGSHPALARSADSQGLGRLECAPRHPRQPGAGRRRTGRRKPRSPRRSRLWHAGRGLTPRSRRGPTAWRQAREAVGHIIGLAGLAPHRWSHLNSNVRQRSNDHAVLQQGQRLSARTEQPQGSAGAGDNATTQLRSMSRKLEIARDGFASNAVAASASNQG